MKSYQKNGILVLDKPVGLSSFKAMQKVKRLLGAAKAGHTGTLDPFATGVLPVCLNQATKAAQYFLEEEKEYRAVMLLGVETDSFDCTGNVVSEVKDIPGDEELIRRTGMEFVGTIRQEVPLFSAVKVDGEPLYKAARRGERLATPVKTVTVSELETVSVRGAEVTFRVRCSKGTYIRSIAVDWGRKLGCGAHLTALRRTRSGSFTIERAMALDDVEEEMRTGCIENRILPLNEALGHWPELVVDEGTAKTVRNGQKICDETCIESLNLQQGQKVRVVTGDSGLVAIMGPIFDKHERRAVGLQSLRVFHCESL